MKTIKQLAHHVNGRILGQADAEMSAVASLAAAMANEIAFFDDLARLKWLHQTKAGAVVLSAQFQNDCPTNAIVVSDPALAIAQIQFFFQAKPTPNRFIHPSAQISMSSQLGQNVSIGANAYIGDHVIVGDNVLIDTGCVIESGVSIGNNTHIKPGCIIHQQAKLGNNVQIDSHAVIGAMPFNGVKSAGVWHQGPAFGTVVIEDDVRIGAGTIVDRGGFSDTIISQGVIIDNLVQIAHDTQIGCHTAVAGCAAIGANCTIGSHCIIGGASAIAANICLSDDVVITGMSTVNKSINKAGVFSSGTMVSDHQRWRKNAARFKQLEQWVDRIKALENGIW